MYDISINVTISIPIIGDDSIIKIAPPNGFTYKQLAFDKYEYRNHMLDDNGKISTDYHYAVHNAPDPYIIVLEKSEIIQLKHEHPANSMGFIMGDDLQKLCEPVKNNYERELFRYFSLLHLFKEGEIARKYSFYKFETQAGCFKPQWTGISLCADMITLILHPMIISNDEITSINELLTVDPKIYALLKDVLIDDLEYSYHVLDDVTNYKNLVTVLEVLFLRGEYGAKKEMLAKRISILLGDTDEEIKTMYSKIKNIYKNRSDATHDGIITNITKNSLDELRDIIRRIGMKYIDHIQSELIKNPNVTFADVKDTMINNLKQQVPEKIKSGIFIE